MNWIEYLSNKQLYDYSDNLLLMCKIRTIRSWWNCASGFICQNLQISIQNKVLLPTSNMRRNYKKLKKKSMHWRSQSVVWYQIMLSLPRSKPSLIHIAADLDIFAELWLSFFVTYRNISSLCYSVSELLWFFISIDNRIQFSHNILCSFNDRVITVIIKLEERKEYRKLIVFLFLCSMCPFDTKQCIANRNRPRKRDRDLKNNKTRNQRAEE